MPRNRILLVEDDQTICYSLKSLLEDDGYRVDTASNGQKAWEKIKSNKYFLILSDINLPELNGRQILARLKASELHSKLILFTGYGSVQDAVECIKKGAFDYFVKPIDDDRLLIAVRRAFEHQALFDENLGLKQQLGHLRRGQFVYQSRAMEVLLEHAKIAAQTDATLLITGESGTGKTLLAKYIHGHSQRKSHPFIEVSCGALSESLLESELFGHRKGAFTGADRDKKGKFEVARGGTVFLDDINSASYGFQIKLLRVIEDKVFEAVGDNETVPADVRIIAATNMNLRELCKERHFREDLFHRLNVVGLKIPALRDRPEDIPVLIHHFISRFSVKYQKEIKSIDDKVLKQLCDYQWPGNIRELENIIERSVIFARGTSLEGYGFPDSFRPCGAPENGGETNCSHEEGGLSEVVDAFEKEHIIKVLKETGQNRTKASEYLKISRATLFNKMKKHGLL